MSIERPDWSGLWVACIVGAALMTVLLAIALLRVRAYSRRLVVRASVTPDGVDLATRSGHRQSVRWEDLKSVVIVTNDSGPLDTDAWWELKVNSGRVFEITGAQPNSRELLEKLQTLEGFDNEAVIKASFSTKNARFVCWKRDTSKAK